MAGDRYRRGVGVMLLNREGKVFVGARIDNPDDAWQMPQGGIEAGDEPWATALRELEEETGIAPELVEKIAECPERLPELFVPFKRELYRLLLRVFAAYL
jgi:putative (di)nucleoside polyphosphate hydrolase